MQPFYSHNDGQIVLYQGDCLLVMPWLIEQGVKIDATITDIPYGTTACSWDVVIPFVEMWMNIKALNKPRGAVVLFGSQPFTSALVMSNVKWFKYAWVWNKNNAAGYATVRHKPFVITEDICVFADGGHNYYPQMVERDKPLKKGGMYRGSEHYSLKPIHSKEEYPFAYPKNILNYGKASHVGMEHPTEKPLELMQYLIRTYTNPGDTVLDFTSGSGTTLHAALIEGRRAIGIERDLDDKGNCLGYCEYTRQRLLGEKPATMHVDGQQISAVQSAMSIF
jgi:site-specific DNA-methyltransferase (adenine-specific)